ncbi:MAG: hypothetical protein BRD30_10490 [Bacteroidetes bacterium QH_2_63_10]|nr:MAG: hypothetical protein BRD30_10490 [Bacteroidetes bacterium QH_2_63_10]
MLNFLKRVRAWWRGRRTQQITPDRARERVRRGAEYLDGVDPDWYRRIDSETLELGDGRHCVLGQLHGEFRLGLGRSDLISMSSAPRTSLSPVAYGFKCVMNVPDEWQDYDYKLLNEAWREAVRMRQENDSVFSDDEVIVSSGDSVPEAPAEPEPAEA